MLAAHAWIPRFNPQHLVSQAWWHTAVISALKKKRGSKKKENGDQMFSVIFSYKASPNPALDTRDLVSKIH